ncbi:unnamed protein product [Nippostrongylus brasiliensis]|uniref:DDE Tnp4 domain-containing protein n=1 Tax=Nippostrongylus brasiliensis TaxID=27835 RepID=A0A0N4Y2K3_NIPBR|nr:unnamed protein product [Nippostrongylus brasiliensis]
MRFLSFDNYLVSLDHQQFHEYTRLTPQEFDELHYRIAHRLEHRKCHRFPVSTIHRLAVTMRFLGHGSAFVTLAHEVRLGRATVMKIVYECCRAIKDELWSDTFPTPTAADWHLSAEQFRRLWRYPRAVASIDGKHFRCKSPSQNRRATTTFNNGKILREKRRFDAHIETLMKCELISEQDVKSLCSKAREILVQEGNVQVFETMEKFVVKDLEMCTNERDIACNKYFMDESTMTLTPCGEFALVMPQTLPLLFFSVINFQSYQSAESFGYIELGSTADESAGFLSRVFFCWTNILIQKGGKLQLNSIDDVFPLPPSLEVANIERQMIKNSPTYFSDGQRYSLSSYVFDLFSKLYFFSKLPNAELLAKSFLHHCEDSRSFLNF